MLQCVEVCCSGLQCVAVGASGLQCASLSFFLFFPFSLSLSLSFSLPFHSHPFSLFPSLAPFPLFSFLVSSLPPPLLSLSLSHSLSHSLFLFLYKCWILEIFKYNFSKVRCTVFLYTDCSSEVTSKNFYWLRSWRCNLLLPLFSLFPAPPPLPPAPPSLYPPSLLLFSSSTLTFALALRLYMYMHTATYCKTLRRTATHCNTMQHT